MELQPIGQALRQQEFVENWQYRGLPTQLDFGDEGVRLMARNVFWHEIKQRSGQLVTIFVDLKDPEEPEEEELKTLEFRICSYGQKRGKIVHQLAATTSVSAKVGENLCFIFKIVDVALATDLKVDVKVMKEACERVFETVVLRCANQHVGNPGGEGEEGEIATQAYNHKFLSALDKYCAEIAAARKEKERLASCVNIENEPHE